MGKIRMSLQSSNDKLYLSKNIVHCFRGTGVVLSQDSQQSQDFYLQERIRYAGDVVLRGVAGHDQVLEFVRVF